MKYPELVQLNLYQASAYILVLLSAYFGLYFVNGHLRRRQHWFKIQRLTTAFKNQKEKLKEKLTPESQKWKEISSLPFRELSSRLQNGQLTAVDVLKAYQYRALQCTEKTNCVVHFRAEEAEKFAQQLDSSSKASRKNPLHGIPVSIKECFNITGTESTAGHAPYIGVFVDKPNAPIIEFLHWAGAVPFCKTNIPQGMLTYDSRNAVYGTTSNPHDVTRGPGGSSSGEGALLGGGGSMIGVGNDVGGSLRIPAAFSGCYVLKPTSQRFISGGTCPGELYPQVMTLDFLAAGFLAREYDALQAAYRTLYSIETFDRFPFSNMPPIPFREDVFSSKRKLRIAFYQFDGVTHAASSTKRAVEEARTALAHIGHELVEWEPPGAKEAFLIICEALAIDGSTELIRTLADDVEVAYANRANYATMTWSYWRKWLISHLFLSGFPAEVLRSLKKATTSDEFNDLYKRVRDFRRRFNAEFSKNGFDAILCPAFACPALPINSPREALGAATYTCLFNALNWPAGNMPFTKVTAADQEAMQDYPGHINSYHAAIKAGLLSDSIGLPVAVQIAAPPFHEELVLRIMNELQHANSGSKVDAEEPGSQQTIASRLRPRDTPTRR